MWHHSIVIVLCSLVVHNLSVTANDYQLLTSTPDAPVYVSRITGKSFSMTPYYEHTGIKAFHEKYHWYGQGVTIAIIGGDVNLQQRVFTDAASSNEPCMIDKEDYTKQHQKSSVVSYQIDHRHGTEMAAIIRARTKTFKGVAPEARLNIYKVFASHAPTSTSIVLEAFQAAIRDKADVVVLPEIGITDSSDIPLLKREIISVANQGVIILVAASNHNYPVDPTTSAYFPYNGLPVISVGGAKLSYRMSHWFTMLNVPLIRFTFTSPCSDMKTKLDEVNMISLAELRTRNRASMNELVRNKIVLVMDQQMGDDELLSMIQRMDIAGIVTDIRDHQQLSCGRPLFIISKSDGQLISGMYRKNPRQMLVFAGEHGNINENSPALVDSMDPTSPYGKPSVKPDILAPSQDLFTVTNTAFNHGYIQYSGIDAAVSYAAGAVALFIQAKERTNINVFTVKRALQNTASDVYYSLTRKGLQPVKYPYAGLLNVEQAHFMTR